ncbi:uncharacterized protein LOC143444923 [Clavelina lepadiformis]|uniref:uncharacterized protein LOC143444923 n=1 Tax=Clavelina lepadiformis TaxID=159417 RepID=UPI004042544F
MEYTLILLMTGILVSAMPAENKKKTSPIGAIDLTLAEGSFGEEVVQACLQKIDSLFAFSNDFGFMKRISFVETEYGRNYSNRNKKRGIWQISTNMENIIFNNLSSLNSTLKNFNLIDEYHNLVYERDYSIPFYSALVGRLYIEIMVGLSTLPGTLMDQADWWANNYHSGASSDVFSTQVAEHESNLSCSNERMDLWFLLDSSGSIGTENFKTSLDFVSHLSSKFNISSDRVRTGMSIYSTWHTIISYFNQHTSNQEFMEAVKTTHYKRGGTNTGAAITKVLTKGFNERNGARDRSQGVPRVLIVLTDGQSNDDVLQPVYDAHEAGITVFAVGVGHGIKFEEINLIASNPDSTYAYKLSQFNTLLPILQRVLTEQTCTASATLLNNTLVTIRISSGSSHYSSIKIPRNGYVTISLSTESVNGSSGQGYIGTFPNPNSALHSVAFQLTGGNNITFVATGDGILLKEGSKISEISSFKLHDDTLPIYISINSKGQLSLPLEMRAIVVNAVFNTATTSTTLPTTILATTSVSPDSSLTMRSLDPSATTVEKLTTLESSTSKHNGNDHHKINDNYKNSSCAYCGHAIINNCHAGRICTFYMPK